MSAELAAGPGLDGEAQRLLGRIARGERVPFGRLLLSKEGVHRGRRTLGWDEAHFVPRAGEILVFRGIQPQPWAREVAARLPELPALLAATRVLEGLPPDWQDDPAAYPVHRGRARLIAAGVTGVVVAVVAFALLHLRLEAPPREAAGFAVVAGALAVVKMSMRGLRRGDFGD